MLEPKLNELFPLPVLLKGPPDVGLEEEVSCGNVVPVGEATLPLSSSSRRFCIPPPLVPVPPKPPPPNGLFPGNLLSAITPDAPGEGE